MAKKFEDAAAALAPLAKQFPSQTVGSNKGKGKEDATNNDDPLRPYQFYLRQSLKGELKALAASPRARCVDSEPSQAVGSPCEAATGPPRCPTTVPLRHCARVGASASTAPRLPTRAHASGWIARAAGALLCLHTTDRATATHPRRAVSRRCHHRVPSCTPRRASSRI